MATDGINEETSSIEVLKQAVIDCFNEVGKRQKLTVDMLKSYLEPVFIKEGYREESPDGEVKSILVVRLDEIGDNVLTSGFLRELRRNYPKAYITLIVNPIVAPMVELCPYVNEVIGFWVTFINDSIKRFDKITSLCYDILWKRKYDLAFLMRWDADGVRLATFLAYFSGARERIGYSSEVTPLKQKFDPYINELLTMPIVNPENIIHEAEKNFYLLKVKNLRVEDKSMELWYGKEDYFRMKRIIGEFAKERKIIAVSAGSNWLHKVYPVEQMAIALNKIKNPGNCFLLLGGKDEEDMVKTLQKNLTEEALNLTAKTTLRETAAALSLCSMYIGMDTGTKHMAAALNLPVIEINCTPHTIKPFPLLAMNRCAPWQTPSIIVRPKKAMPPCDKSNPWGGCEMVGKTHCIAGIDPLDIVEAYEKLSDIKIYK